MTKKIIVEEAYKTNSKEHRQTIIRQSLMQLIKHVYEQPETGRFSEEARSHGK